MVELDDNTLSNMKNIDKRTCRDWGGEWKNGRAHVSRLGLSDDFEEKTKVRSGSDAIEAFEKYEEYFTHVLENKKQENKNVVFIPCGSEKPIGFSSIHKKKLNALEESGILEIADLYIMSEPCTVVPHEWRLTLPPVNYDFPPEYTKKEDYPQVFNKFVDNLVRFFREYNYDKVFSYLVEGHQNKMDKAVQKESIEQVKIPGASYNPDSEDFSGDYFKSTEDMANKIKSILELKHEGNWKEEGEVLQHYKDYLEENNRL